MEHGSETESVFDPSVKEKPTKAMIVKPNPVTTFVYNHNPFYLISCLLVVYGCQDLALSEGGVVEKTMTMTGGICLYAILMVFVCIAVVRIAKVWEDARSLLMVVLICLVAATTGFDELCIADGDRAIAFAGAVSAVILVAIESVLWCCRLPLGFWYRVSLYAHFAVLVVSPLLLGRAVSNRNDSLANWGSTLFSVAVSGTILLLIPAMRCGAASVTPHAALEDSKADPETNETNASPWRWPMYPICAFVVLVSLSGIRAHAIWVSFGFYGTAGKFEPFLLMPMLASAIVVLVETSIGLRSRKMMKWSVILPPFLLLCGVTRAGATWLPIQYDLTYQFGSALTVCCGVSFLIYAWMAARHIPKSSYGMPAMLLLAALIAPMPSHGVLSGMEAWMLVGMSGAILVLLAMQQKSAAVMWTLSAFVLSSAIVMAGEAYGERTIGLIAGSTLTISSMLIIGACYEGTLASVLRHFAALAMTVLVGVAIAFSTFHQQPALNSFAASICFTSFLYGCWITRKGWLFVGAVQATLLALAFSYQTHQSGAFHRVNWPLASGAACLCVGCMITTAKTGVHRRRMFRRRKDVTVRFRPGL